MHWQEKARFIWHYKANYWSMLKRMLARGLSFRKALFTEIFQFNLWQGRESVSGPGSGLDESKSLRQQLVRVIQERDVSSIVDIPCGDFFLDVAG